MQLYNCKVRLGGSNNNEVFKPSVTAPEIILLRADHGYDAVVDIVPTEMKRLSHAEERIRLAGQYKVALVTELFGPDHRELPNRVPDIDHSAIDGPGESEDVSPEDLKPRRRRASGKGDRRKQVGSTGTPPAERGEGTAEGKTDHTAMIE